MRDWAPVEIRDADEVPVVAVADQKIKRSEDQKIEEEDQEAHEDDLPIFSAQGGSASGGQSSDLAASPEIPTQMNLAVPFTSQAPEKNWDQPWQDACEEAAVLMLDAYYKGYGLSPLFARDEILKMVSWEEEQGWGLSIEIEKMKELAQEVTKLQSYKVIENPTVEQIKQSVAAGHPVIVMAYGKALPNPYFRNGGPEYHALVIRGYTETEFITNDPGTWRGENFRYTFDDLMNAMHDWNNGDVPNGKRVALVLVDDGD